MTWLRAHRVLAVAGLVVVGLVVLFVGGVIWAREEFPKVLYNRVTVPVEVIRELEPDTVVQWRERIVYRTVRPTQVADAPGGAVRDVDAFCGAAGFSRAAGDTTQPREDPRLLIRSGRLAGATLLLTGPVSDGTLRQSSFDGIRGDFSFRAVGDSLLVQSSRYWWVKECGADMALGTGAGAGAGVLGNNVQTGSMVGAGLGALRCAARFF